MAWIESHQELARHPKTKRLARLLNVPAPFAVGMLHYLWWWAMDYAPDGDLTRYEDGDIADACEWDGDAAQYVAALIGAGFVDDDRQIHDWYEYAGRLIDKREQNKERKRRSRGSHAPVTRPSQGSPEDGRDGHRATEQNLTEPNHTVPKDIPPVSPKGEPQADEPKIMVADLVQMTSDEYEKLTDLLGTEERDRLILEYAAWISGQTARVQKKRNAYLTILNWHRREAAKPRAPAASKGARQMDKFQQMLREAEERERSGGHQTVGRPFG